jgi:chaperonin GroES
MPPLVLRPSACAGELVPVSVKEGDKVLLPEYGGTVVKLQEKE